MGQKVSEEGVGQAFEIFLSNCELYSVINDVITAEKWTLT